MSKIMNDEHHFKAKPIFMAVVLMTVQIGFFALIYHYFSDKIEYFSALQTLLALSLIVYIINRPISTAYQMAWLVVIAVLPVFGGLLYLFLHIMPGVDRLNARLDSQIENTKPYLVTPENAILVKESDSLFFGLTNYLYERCLLPVTTLNQLTYYPSGEKALYALKEELKKAKEFIFMEYFIVSEGKILDEILEILIEKVNLGVEVRLMYDGNTVFNLPRGFQNKLEKLGIACHVFSPISPIISTYQNNRDHRKITVIDGKVAFTGGFNLADEYANLKTLYGHWKDAGIKIEGAGVDNFTGLFLQMWHMNKGSLEKNAARYFHKMPLEVPECENPTWAVGYGDAPGDSESLGENIYLHLLFNAKKYVYIMTPYLILDDILLKALTQAAKRGLDIKIILPHIPDKKIPFYIARSYYDRLLEAGVKIYEYTPGFIHSKVWVSDDSFGTVGTVNVDFRSLYLNFENGLLFYDKAVARDIRADFIATLEQCIKINQWYYRKRPFYERFSGRVARIFGALM